jgi:hypothetical protein
MSPADVAVGMRVEADVQGEEGWDVGEIHDLRSAEGFSTGEPMYALVGWDSGVSTWTPIKYLRPA